MRSNLKFVVDSVAREPLFTIAPDLSRIFELHAEQEAETLGFLAARPVNTVVMTSFILDNGIQSPLNRGKFWGHRNSEGQLDGVALIGHSTLVEARTDEALKALAVAARTPSVPIRLIMSSGTSARTFWDHLNNFQKEPAMSCTELLFEVGFPFLVQNCEYDMRLARVEELEAIARAHAEVAEIECGRNPLQSDREGFLKRVLRRIEQGRIFVVFDGDELVFKADVIAETDAVAYLEGVYVAPDHRRQGIAPKCLSQVCLQLLDRVQRVCLLSNVAFEGAHRSFLKAGMRNTDSCTTLFV